MLILLIAIIALVVVTATLHFFSSSNDEEKVNVVENCSTCNGENTKCEQECMMEASLKAPEYFNDEELDQYAGRPSDSYNDEETEEFAEVLYTLRKEEVKPWLRSLRLREINLPDALKDEAMIMSEE